MAWQLQDAKARFGELVQKAIDDGPQTVTRHGKAAVVVPGHAQRAGPRLDWSRGPESFRSAAVGDPE